LTQVAENRFEIDPGRWQLMARKTDMHAVELVRRIRDQQAEMLEGKSNEEIIEFFRKAGEAFRKRVHTGSRKAADKPLQPAR